MHQPSANIAKEGYPIIFFASLCAICFALLNMVTLALLTLIGVFFALHFFRDPERIIPIEPHIAVSPADGKVIRIETRLDPILQTNRTCISIFMDVFSVHVNRSPVAGKVEEIQYHQGLFLNAAWDKASRDNERCAYLVTDTEQAAFTFVQVAGLIARRIVCRTEIGDQLSRGQRFGLIRFGSRVDVFIPSNYKTTVHIGSKVFAGQSIIAEKIEK